MPLSMRLTQSLLMKPELLLLFQDRVVNLQKLYELCDVLVRRLERGEFKGEMTKIKAIMQEVDEEDGDYVVDEKNKIVNLTEEGVRKVEQFFHIDNYADVENLELQHNVTLALRAHSLMTRDKDYVVKDGGNPYR